jgi:[acyl-carrier-protein] S-malonyltransferase
MGKFLFDNFTETQHLFEEASDILSINFKKLCFDGPESELTLTENTQPALLLISTSYFRTLEKNSGFRPQFAAGHSLGEYSALVAAKVLAFKDAIQAVRTRGLAMQTACPVGEGGMAAVLGWDESDIETLCKWVEKSSGFEPLRPANFNSPGQIVISGSAKALEWLKQNSTAHPVEGKRLKIIPLNVSAPFHSPQEKMESVLNDTQFNDPLFPIVQNTTAQETENTNVLRRELIAQVSAPVKWSQSVQRMKQLGVSQMVEVGHGKVLTGLVKKIDSEAFQTFNISNLEELKAFEQFVAVQGR